MSNWNNNSGKPLASDSWLEAHHRAKLVERIAFSKKIAAHSPQRIVDLGCGIGLWLELCAQVLNTSCELVGIDVDPECLSKAETRLKSFSNKKQFIPLDLENYGDNLPEADIYLAFNIFPYIPDISALLRTLRKKIRPGGFLIVRQYDGSMLRIGPMNSRDRQIIDTSLMTSLAGSSQFKHYDLDRVFEALRQSDFARQDIDFETFSRLSPYPIEFQDYFTISEDAADRLLSWMKAETGDLSSHRPSYFVEVDMVAWLS
jgi:SAM-dependent methyltransferase